MEDSPLADVLGKDEVVAIRSDDRAFRITMDLIPNSFRPVENSPTVKSIFPIDRRVHAAARGHGNRAIRKNSNTPEFIFSEKISARAYFNPGVVIVV